MAAVSLKPLTRSKSQKQKTKTDVKFVKWIKKKQKNKDRKKTYVVSC